MPAPSKSYQARTMEACRDRGRLVAMVERPLPRSRANPGGKKVDLYGCFDLLACSPEEGIIGIQVTGPNGGPDHWKTLTVERAYEADIFLRSGGTIELWTWTQRLKAPRSKTDRRKVWVPTVKLVTLADLGSVAA